MSTDASPRVMNPAADPTIVGRDVELGLLERLAARGPIVVAIDDLQWLDAASVDGLAFVVLA